MSNYAIKVENISKCYRLGVIGRQTMQDEIRYWGYKLLGKNPDSYLGTLKDPLALEMNNARVQGKEFWALRDVSFTAKPGEVLGVIGGNGAGKSTLLKILGRITEPTSGDAWLEGRVASLLEVGTGFHPELTGRENAYLNGTILGMSSAEVTRKFDEIVDFSGMETFIDTPVKRYSSGMLVRLAFAVAAHLEPEILLIDEVLAVGDVEFQRKCLGKMDKVAAEGRTILFVSHNMNAVRRLCTRAILIDEGGVVDEGPAGEVVNSYYDSVKHDAIVDVHGRRQFEGVMGFINWSSLPLGEQPFHKVYSGEGCTLRFLIGVKQEVHNINIGIAIYTQDGELVWAMKSIDDVRHFYSFTPGEHVMSVSIDYLPVRMAEYRMHVSLNQSGKALDLWEAEPALNVVLKDAGKIKPRWQGMVNLVASMTVEARESHDQ